MVTPRRWQPARRAILKHARFPARIWIPTRSSAQRGVGLLGGDPSFRGNVFRFNCWHHIGNRSGKGNPKVHVAEALVIPIRHGR